MLKFLTDFSFLGMNPVFFYLIIVFDACVKLERSFVPFLSNK